jgi:hypothetical protein
MKKESAWRGPVIITLSLFSKRLAVGHIASHGAIFRAQSSERTFLGSTGRTAMIFSALE